MMGAEHEPMNGFQVGRTLFLEGDWPIVLHKVALKAPKLPSEERVYTEKKKTLRKCTSVQRVQTLTDTKSLHVS